MWVSPDPGSFGADQVSTTAGLGPNTGAVGACLELGGSATGVHGKVGYSLHSASPTGRASLMELDCLGLRKG